MTKYITKGFTNMRGSNKYDVCLAKIEYHGHEYQAREIHKICQNYWKNLAVITYSVDKEHRDTKIGPMWMPVVKKVFGYIEN